MARSYVSILLLVLLPQCSGVRNISKRELRLQEKSEGPRLVGRQPPPLPRTQEPQIFFKKKRIRVEPALAGSATGSLFNIDDERNYFFLDKGPVVVGRHLQIQVRWQDNAKNEKVAAAEKDEPKEGQTDLEAELLKGFSKLEAPEDAKLRVLKNFKVQIAQRFENGDVLALYQRSSISGEEGNQIRMQARIPYEALTRGGELTTDDLMEVNFLQVTQGETVERRSTGWADEYTLRMSGFDEARSQAAVTLDEKRKELNDLRRRFQDKVRNFAERRRTVSKERDDLVRSNNKASKELKSLKEQLEKAKSKVADALDSTRPESKPSDQQDGADAD